MIRATQFGSGNQDSVVIDDTGTSVVYPGDPTDSVKWLLIVADLSNSDVCYIHLHPTENAVWDKGIPLYPGGYIELSEYMGLYNGVIRGIAATGKTAKLHWHDGR